MQKQISSVTFGIYHYLCVYLLNLGFGSLIGGILGLFLGIVFFNNTSQRLEDNLIYFLIIGFLLGIVTLILSLFISANFIKKMFSTADIKKAVLIASVINLTINLAIKFIFPAKIVSTGNAFVNMFQNPLVGIILLLIGAFIFYFFSIKFFGAKNANLNEVSKITPDA